MHTSLFKLKATPSLLPHPSPFPSLFLLTSSSHPPLLLFLHFFHWFLSPINPLLSFLPFSSHTFFFFFFLPPDHIVLKGDWSNDSRNGTGTYTYTNGDKYEGEWSNNMRHGHGAYTYAETGAKVRNKWPLWKGSL